MIFCILLYSMLNAHLDVLIERTLNLHVCTIYFTILLRLLKVMLLTYIKNLMVEIYLIKSWNKFI